MTDFDLALLERRQVELVVNRKRQGMMTAFAVSNFVPCSWALAGRRLACLMSCASFCRSSLDPLEVEIILSAM